MSYSDVVFHEIFFSVLVTVTFTYSPNTIFFLVDFINFFSVSVYSGLSTKLEPVSRVFSLFLFSLFLKKFFQFLCLAQFLLKNE